jgi:hypothetical protein
MCAGNNVYTGTEVSGSINLNVGDVIMWEMYINAGAATRTLYGENEVLGATTASFFRID